LKSVSLRSLTHLTERAESCQWTFTDIVTDYVVSSDLHLLKPDITAAGCRYVSVPVHTRLPWQEITVLDTP